MYIKYVSCVESKEILANSTSRFSLIYVIIDQWHCKSQNYTDKFTKYNFLHENNSKALFDEILAISM